MVFVCLRQCANALHVAFAFALCCVPFYYGHILWLYFFFVLPSRYHDVETEKQRQKCHCVTKEIKFGEKKCVISFWYMVFVCARVCECEYMCSSSKVWNSLKNCAHHTQYGFQTTGRFFIDDRPYSLISFDLCCTRCYCCSIAFQLPSSILVLCALVRDGDRIHWSYEW